VPRTPDIKVVMANVAYRISRSKWKEWLQARARGESPTLGTFNARVITEIDRDLTDFTADDAQTELNSMAVTEETDEEDRPNEDRPNQPPRRSRGTFEILPDSLFSIRIGDIPLDQTHQSDPIDGQEIPTPANQ